MLLLTAEKCYSESVQGNRLTATPFEVFSQFSFNGKTLRRDPVTNLASGFPEQKPAKGVAGFSIVPQSRMAYSKARTWRMQAAKAKGRHTKQEWWNLQHFYRFRCLRCGKHKSEVLCLEKDHVYPVRLGGCDCIGNIQPLCSSCNARKGAEDLTDYRQAAKEMWNLDCG